VIIITLEHDGHKNGGGTLVRVKEVGVVDVYGGDRGRRSSGSHQDRRGQGTIARAETTSPRGALDTMLKLAEKDVDAEHNPS
jgi:hypothetical protein